MPDTTTSDLLVVDARRKSNRGVYLITSARGSQYYLELRGSIAGGMRAISANLKFLLEGVVGGEECCPDSRIQVGHSMHLVRSFAHRVRTSPVVDIEPVDVSIDDMLCPRCKVGFRPAGQPCALCHLPPDSPADCDGPT